MLAASPVSSETSYSVRVALGTGTVLAGVAGAVLGDALAGVVSAFAVAAFLAGALQPRLLAPLIAAGCVVLPPYVGWLLPGGAFINMQRGVMYGGLLGVTLWGLRERMEGRWLVPIETLRHRPLRLSLLLLCSAWLIAPFLAAPVGTGNAVRALNAALYEALALWVGLSFTKGADGRRTLQLVLALLLLYTVPYWVYELQAGHTAFAWYVPPLPDLLSGRGQIFRNGRIRVAATFGQPLAFDQFLLIASPAAFSLVFTRLPRLLGVGLAALGVAALVATGSRSPWLAIVLAGGALFILRRRRLRVALAIAAVALAVAAIPVVQALRAHSLAREAKSLLLTRFSRRSEAEFSAASRVFLTLGALREIRARPVTGYGVNATATSARLPSVDDYYLAEAVEQGVVVAGLASIALLAAWLGLARARLPRGALWIVFGVGAYLVEWLFVGLHDTSPLMFLVLGSLFASQASVGPEVRAVGPTPILRLEGGI